MAPCAGKCTQEEYAEMISGVISFLNGDYGKVMEKLQQDMEEAAAAMRNEKAARIRDRMKDVR